MSNVIMDIFVLGCLNFTPAKRTFEFEKSLEAIRLFLLFLLAILIESRNLPQNRSPPSLPRAPGCGPVHPHMVSDQGAARRFAVVVGGGEGDELDVVHPVAGVGLDLGGGRPGRAELGLGRRCLIRASGKEQIIVGLPPDLVIRVKMRGIVGITHTRSDSSGTTTRISLSEGNF